MKHAGQWVGLLLLSLLLAWAAEAANLPAALLLGSLLAAIGLGVSGGRIRLPRWTFLTAQTLIGAMVARAISPDILTNIQHDWPVMLALVMAPVSAGAIVGWILARFGSLPGTTAAWGSTPGGASAMVVMAEEFGADPRLVGFMQYLRMLLVVLSAALATRFLAQHGGPGAGQIAALPPVTVMSLAGMLGVAVVGGIGGRLLKIPGGALLGPMMLGAVLHSSGLVEIAIPDILRNAAYMAVGWYIGLGFNRTVLMHALKAIPQLLLSNALLIGLCALCAWGLARALHTDPLTAYLATSPGGLDSIAIIAMDQPINLPLVLAFQTLRVFLVIMTGPFLAKLISRTARVQH